MVIHSQEFYEYFEGLIWGQSTDLERLIIYTMWPFSEFTEAEVIEEFRQRDREHVTFAKVWRKRENRRVDH